MDLVRLLMSEVSDSSLFLYLESIAFHIFIFKEFRGIANKTVKNIGNFNLSTYVFFSVIHFLLENKVIQSCKSWKKENMLMKLFSTSVCSYENTRKTWSTDSIRQISIGLYS